MSSEGREDGAARLFLSLLLHYHFEKMVVKASFTLEFPLRCPGLQFPFRLMLVVVREASTVRSRKR